MINRILELLKINNISAKKLTDELGLSNSAVTDWKKGRAKPSTDAVIKIANYFSVSTDYILTGKNFENPSTYMTSANILNRDFYSLIELLKDNNMLIMAQKVLDDAYVVFTKDFNIWLWSKSAEKKFGYTKEDILGKSINVLIPNDRLNEFEHKVKSIKQNRIIEGFETKRIHKNGNLIDVLVTMAPLYDSNGIFKGAIGSYRDISEKLKFIDLLKESENRYKFALEGGKFGVWDWNIETRYLNDPYLFKEFLGYNDLEIENSIDYFFSKVHPDDLSHIQQKINNHFKGEEYIVEYRMKCRNNEYKWIRSKGKVHSWSSDGKPLRMIGTNEDIADKKKIEDELKEKYNQLEKLKQLAEEANKAKSQFLANMSHEIRTPMNGIFAMVQLLKSSDLSNEQMRYIWLINKSLNNLKEIIDDILDLSKIESGKITLNEEAFDLRSTINIIYNNLLVTGNSKGLEISYFLDPNIDFHIISDELKLMQILNNLISNAMKFTDKGYISFKTKLLASNDNTAKIEFRIKDTGIGIKDDFKDKLFQNFCQCDITSNKKYKGTGLGLSITKQLSELFKGELNYESEYGKGSTFIFTCEFRKIIAIIGNKHKEFSFSNDVEFKIQNQEYTILCVEDNIINQEVMGNILARKGYKYLPAYNGREAINLLKENKVNLILMDIQLPELDGFQTTEIIRQELDKEHKLPIIAITAYAMQEDRKKCIDAGMIDYISKPFDIEELYKVIEKYLSKSTVQ